MDQNFDRPVFPKFEALRVEGLPYIFETCRGGPRHDLLGVDLLGCVLKRLKILIKFPHLGPRGKMDKNFDRPIFPKFEAP